MHALEKSLIEKCKGQLIESLESGAPSSLKDILEPFDAETKSGLLKILLPLELDFRRRNGDEISGEDYTGMDEARELVLRWCKDSEDEQACPPEVVKNNQSIPATNSFDQDSTEGFNYEDSSPACPSRIGCFRLVRKIGSGGMGQVWLAQQAEPVKRKVAIKLIRDSRSGSREHMDRFEAERQAIALMDHPNIARLLDAGTTDEGDPYFAMELVNGVPLTEYCQAKALQLNERLDLFNSVCKAVQHAHQKGIIHRDLKPSNILVTEVGDQAVPKVIDFGLAKAFRDRRLLGEHSLTAFGGVMGTPLYMAPEQTLGDPNDVDTRADIYALGTILYELLTGTTPIDRDDFASKRIADFLDLIRECNFEAPSRRLARVTRKPDQKLEQHQWGIGRELDLVVLKALSPERDRRYPTPIDLAADISNFVSHRPVQAAPPSNGYRIKKFIRRNRFLVSMTALTLCAFFAGFIGIAYGFISASQLALSEREAKDRATALKLKAEIREDSAIEAVRSFGRIVSENSELKNNPELNSLRQSLLKEPLEFFRSLREELTADNDTRTTSVLKLAQAAEELAILSEDMGDREDALRAYDEAVEMQRSLLSGEPEAQELRSVLASTLGNRGNMHRHLGNLVEAEANYQESLALLEELYRERDDPDAGFGLAGSYMNFGTLNYDLGKIGRAAEYARLATKLQEELLRRGYGTPEDRLDYCGSLMNLGTFLRFGGQLDEAIVAYRQTIEYLEENGSGTDDPKQAMTMVAAYTNIAQTKVENDGILAAESDLKVALGIAESVALAHPTLIPVQSGYANLLSTIGIYFRQAGKPQKAISAQIRAGDVQQKLADSNPSDIQLQIDVATSKANLGNTYVDVGMVGDARSAYLEALTIQENLAERHPEIGEFSSDAGVTLTHLALLDSNTGNWKSARAKFVESANLQNQALEQDYSNSRVRARLEHTLSLLLEEALASRDVATIRVAREYCARVAASDPRYAEIDAQLEEWKSGKFSISDDDLFALGDRAYKLQLFADSAKVFGLAIEQQKDALADRETQHRYNAACSASLALSDQSVNTPAMSPSSRVLLLRYCLSWLTQELDEWERLLKQGNASDKRSLIAVLSHWQEDPDLTAIRRDNAPDWLSDAEKSEIEQLWIRVSQLCNIAGSDTAAAL